MLLFNKSVKLHYNFIKKQKSDRKMKIVRQWKVSFVCIFRYLIINNPVNPDALYQDQSDKTPQEVKSHLISNQSESFVLKADYFDHPNW